MQKTLVATQKHHYDNKDLYPFQVDELHANVFPIPTKNSGVKMHLTFFSLLCNQSKRKDRGLKNAAICKCSTMGSEQ